MSSRSGLRKDTGILVLYGGWSAEREVSLASGRAVLDALGGAGYRVKGLELSSDEPRLSVVNRIFDELESEQVGVIYLALHGPFGEDGTIQGLLELAGVPYNGSGLLASALGNDKYIAKQIFISSKITTPKQSLIRHGQRPDSCPLPFPVVLKPRALGSSIGVSIVETEADFPKALEQAAAFGQDVLVEAYMRGKEIQAGILDGKPLPLVEVVSANRFYDYDAKYTPGRSEHRIPAPIPKRQYDAAQRIACDAYAVLGCAGAARVDLIAEETGTLYVLEVNTLPGMTASSLLPEAAREAGMSFLDLVVHELEGALSRAPEPVP